MKRLLPFIVLASVFCSCEKDGTQVKQEPKDLQLTKTATDVIRSDNDFGLAIFREAISKDTESANIFVSPTSIAFALAMTYNGADGETKTAMESALKKQGFTIDEINASYKSLMDALQSVDPKVLLEIANSIWYREGFEVLPDFINVNRDFYNAEVSSLDFNNGAEDIINGWVDDKTHGKIEKIIEGISADAVMYLVNAIYFKGIWQYEFEKSKTVDAPFTITGGNPVNVPMMKQSATFPLYVSEKFSMIELPYGRGNFSMIVLLPNYTFSTSDIVNSLTPENWDAWIAGLHERNVNLSLPKFTFEYKNELKDELSGMGMGIAFTAGADFSKINGVGGLLISKVIHKTFVEVNEEGTEAAAVTAVEIELTSGGGNSSFEFNVDHPFLFALRETTTGAILFMGQVQNPLVKENGE